MHQPGKRWRSFLLVVAAVSSLSVYGEDAITLTTGEVMHGRIVSETDKQVEIEVANADRTILSKRVIPKAEMKTVQRETPEQAAERKTFESLARYRLNPNSAYPTNYYPAVITAFDKFVAAYPQSDHAAQVNTLLADWKAECPQAVLAAQKGLVKFRGQWLTPQQAQAIADEERRRQEATRQQQEEARRRQAEQAAATQRQVEESSSQQQQQNQTEKKASSAARHTGGGYQVDVNSAIP